MSISRRTLLSGAASVPAAAAANSASALAIEVKRPSIDDFLATASAVDRARYHAHALADAMNEERPGFYVCKVDWKGRFALIIDRKPQGGEA